MKKNLILATAALFILAACNNSGEDKEKKSDSLAMDHDSMHHTMPTSGNIPPVPDIPAGAKVTFTNLKDGATVSSPLKITMGTEVMKIDTAGPVLAGYGHHHLFIDAEDSLPVGTVVPKDSTHLHFGKGQTETTVQLTPGKHKLTLQFADGLHRSYGGKLATTISVNVKK
jgi:hypothetical protein